jgi:tetratricopeptide (TPR) repeat protein
MFSLARSLPTILAAATLFAGAALAGPVTLSKDQGPASACDAHAKSSVAWSACVEQAKAGTSSADLFYAGYWLARTGKYQEALGYLTLANHADPRVVTYIGFATRKLGDVDAALPFYRQALELNPNYSVARAYMGEAFLQKREPAKAKAELAEIATRCGTGCAEYLDLAQHIADYEKAAG